MIDKGQWWEFGLDIGVTPLLFKRCVIFNDHRESGPWFNISSKIQCFLTVQCTRHYTGVLGTTQTTGWAPPAGLTNTSSNSNLVFPRGLPSRYWPGSTLLSSSGWPVLGCRVIWLWLCYKKWEQRYILQIWFIFRSAIFRTVTRSLRDADGGKHFLIRSSKTPQSGSIIFRYGNHAGHVRCSTSLLCSSNHSSKIGVLVNYHPDTQHHLQGTMFEPLGAHGPTEWFGSPWPI